MVSVHHRHTLSANHIFGTPNLIGTPIVFIGTPIVIFPLGFWVCDKAGKMRELKSGMPQLDPCCFPLLHPRGTPGWRWFMKKRGVGVPTELEELRMQEKLYDALYTENDGLLRPSTNDNPENDTDEESEEECELDDDSEKHPAVDQTELVCRDNSVNF